MSGRLEGKVAFITGAARGQGRSHAVRLAQEGADIIAVDLMEQIESNPYPLATPEDMKETVRLVEAQDRRIIASKADVRSRDQLREAVANGVARSSAASTSSAPTQASCRWRWATPTRSTSLTPPTWTSSAS